MGYLDNTGLAKFWSNIKGKFGSELSVTGSKLVLKSADGNKLSEAELPSVTPTPQADEHTVSGSMMQILNAYNDAPIQAFKLYGKSTQNGTPTPTSPVEIKSIENPTITVCGKNLFDADTKMPLYGVFTKQADGSWYVPNAGQAHNKVLWSNTSNYIGAMTISWYGKFDSSSSRGGGIWVRFSDDSIVSVNSSVYIAMFNTFSKAVLTVNSTTEKPIKEIIFSYADVTATYFKDIQIEFGSTATDFEPYKNGGSVSIGGGAKYTNQVPISTDKNGNIYNGIGYQNNTRIKSSGAVVTDSAANSFTTGFIPCKSGDVIRFSGHYIEGADGALNTTFYAQDKATKAGYSFTPYSWKNAGSTGVEANYAPYEYDTANSRVLWFTVPQKASGYQDIAYVQFTLVSSGGNGSGVVITVNEEIVVDTKTFCSVRDVKDELIVNKDGTGKLTQKIGKYEFDGTETIGRNAQYGYVYYIAELSNLGGKSQAKESIMPDRYVASAAIATNGTMYMRPNGNGFILHDDRYQALADLKAYLKAQKAAGTPLTVLYELATPIETELTAEEVNAILSLKTFSPTTVIANDKGAEMEVTYIDRQNIQYALRVMNDAIHPVGCIHISTVDVNPEIYYGGTWERIQDTFLLAAGSTYAAGTTGGEATHKLTQNETPSHSHTLKFMGNTAEIWSLSTQFQGGSKSQIISYGTGVGGVDITSTGGSQAHNNMPPYLAVYVWKRVK